MSIQFFQSLLALVGFGILPYSLRWQLGFCLLDSVKVGWRADLYFSISLIFIAQRFLF